MTHYSQALWLTDFNSTINYNQQVPRIENGKGSKNLLQGKGNFNIRLF